MDLAWLVLIGFCGAVTVQLAALAVAWRLKRVDFVDSVWGISFIGIITALWMNGHTGNAASLVGDILVTIWALRLSSHISRRFIRSKEQDRRYTELMSNWPSRFKWLQVFVRIFIVQAALATIVGLPIIVLHSAEPMTFWPVAIGALVWLIGFNFEVIADWQLRKFIRSSRTGELMQSGLWRYSCHPNYFGEITMWWGLAVIGLAVPHGWIGIIGAVTINLLICFVSGIPPAEKNAASKKGWQKYKQKTSPLIPWTPKQ